MYHIHNRDLPWIIVAVLQRFGTTILRFATHIYDVVVFSSGLCTTEVRSIAITITTYHVSARWITNTRRHDGNGTAYHGVSSNALHLPTVMPRLRTADALELLNSLSLIRDLHHLRSQ